MATTADRYVSIPFLTEDGTAFDGAFATREFFDLSAAASTALVGSALISLLAQSAALTEPKIALTVVFDDVDRILAPLVVQFDILAGAFFPLTPLTVVFTISQQPLTPLTLTFDILGEIVANRLNEDIQAPVAAVTLT